MSKICSSDCKYYKRGFKPWFYTECKFNSKGYHKDTQDGKYCKFYEMRESKMFKLRKKEEIVNKYIELLRKEEKSEKDKIEIDMLDWLFSNINEVHNQ
ncbi:MAG: hypothetical protein KH321_03165 [Clostridium sp.]|nr:hypothetical protein [Clostridium sp.]